MIVSPELCDAKINSCCCEPEANKTQLISGSELEVAEETEIVTEDVHLECCPLNLYVDSEHIDVLHNYLDLSKAILQSDPTNKDTYYSAEILSENGFHEAHSMAPESVSTMSISDYDLIISEEEPLESLEEDVTATLNLEENLFNTVYDFCDKVMHSSASVIEEATSNCTSSFQDFRIVQKESSEYFISDTYHTEQDHFLTSEGDVTCRKSARIANKILCKQSLKQSDDINKSGDDDPDKIDYKEADRVFKAQNETSKYQSKDYDEEFIPRRNHSNSKHRDRKGRSRSVSCNMQPRSPDSLKALKQEKNRLAARRCRLKQKLLTDRLTSEVQNLENGNEDLRQQISDLQDELLKLQRIAGHHDALISSFPFEYNCPIGSTDVNISSTSNA